MGISRDESSENSRKDHAGDPISPAELEKRNIRRAYEIDIDEDDIVRVRVDGGEVDKIEVNISENGTDVPELIGECYPEIDGTLTKLIILVILILLLVLVWRLGAVVWLVEAVKSWAIVVGTTLPFAPS